MKKLILFPTLAILAAAVVFVASCKKITNADEDAENAAITGQEMGIGLDATNAIFTLIDDLTANDTRFQKTGSSILPPGATITFTDSLLADKDGDPMEYTLDFGPLPGMVCGDGITRAGKLIVKTDSSSSRALSSTTLSTDSFFVKVGGVLAMVEIGDGGISIKAKNTPGTEQLSLKLFKPMIIVTPKERFEFTSLDISSRRTEMGVPGIADDESVAKSQGKGTNSKGKKFDFKTLVDVVRVEKPNCSFPIKGVMDVNSDGVKYTIDFDTDNGACDRKVKLKVAGVESIKTF